jgi:hypothetical protein
LACLWAGTGRLKRTTTEIKDADESQSEPQERLEPEFSEIEKAGSTATIYARCLQEGAAELDTARKEHAAAAGALRCSIIAGEV